MSQRFNERKLVALGYPQFEPTDEQRKMVRILAFNQTPEDRIAEALNIPVPVLRYCFRREMNYATDEVCAIAAQNILELAAQRKDLGVALRANELLVKTRLRSWREPNASDDTPPPRIANMTLQEVEAEIERIKRRGDASAAGEG
jgi:hypothetical protein